MNPWINHVKQFASKHNISYRDALKNPNCKSTYKMVGGNKNIITSLPDHTISAETHQQLQIQQNIVLGITMIMDYLHCSEESALDILSNRYFQEQVYKESGVMPSNEYNCASILVHLSHNKQDKLIKLAKMIYQEQKSRHKEQSEMYGEDNSRYKEQEIQDMMRQFGF